MGIAAADKLIGKFTLKKKPFIQANKGLKKGGSLLKESLYERCFFRGSEFPLLW